MKTIAITNVYAILNEAKLTKMEDADKFKVIKALRVIKPIAKGYEDFVEDAKNKLKDEKYEDMSNKAQDWNKANQNKKRSSLTEAEKEVEVEFEKLSEDAFCKLVSSNDWTCSQILSLSDFIVKE